jgi:hypothetical protein
MRVDVVTAVYVSHGAEGLYSVCFLDINQDVQFIYELMSPNSLLANPKSNLPLWF